MYHTFDRQRRHHDSADVLAELRAATGIDYAHFLERYIRGPAAIPVSRHLSLGGLAFALTARAANAGAPTIDAQLVGALGLDRVGQ